MQDWQSNSKGNSVSK